MKTTQKKVIIVASSFDLRKNLEGYYKVFGYEVETFSRFHFNCIDWRGESCDIMVVVTNGVSPDDGDFKLTNQLKADNYKFLTETYGDTHSPP